MHNRKSRLAPALSELGLVIFLQKTASGQGLTVRKKGHSGFYSHGLIMFDFTPNAFQMKWIVYYIRVKRI